MLLLLQWHLYNDADVNVDVKQLLLLPLLLLLFFFSLLFYTFCFCFVHWNFNSHLQFALYLLEFTRHREREIQIRNWMQRNLHTKLLQQPQSQSAALSAEAAQNATAATEVVKPDFLFGRLLCSCCRCCCLLHFIFDSYWNEKPIFDWTHEVGLVFYMCISFFFDVDNSSHSFLPLFFFFHFLFSFTFHRTQGALHTFVYPPLRRRSASSCSLSHTHTFLTYTLPAAALAMAIIIFASICVFAFCSFAYLWFTNNLLMHKYQCTHTDTH